MDVREPKRTEYISERQQNFVTEKSSKFKNTT